MIRFSPAIGLAALWAMAAGMSPAARSELPRQPEDPARSMHGNVAEWCLDHYRADAYKRVAVDAYKRFPGGKKPALGPVVLPDAEEYSYVVRGGSWDDDADKLRSAARRGSNPEWSIQDPDRPQSIWWHTDATFVGFRIVRPLVEQENLRGWKSQVVKGKRIH